MDLDARASSNARLCCFDLISTRLSPSLACRRSHTMTRGVDGIREISVSMIRDENNILCM
jgi:hypothetical protein